jgi:hypothetical protein
VPIWLCSSPEWEKGAETATRAPVFNPSPNFERSRLPDFDHLYRNSATMASLLRADGTGAVTVVKAKPLWDRAALLDGVKQSWLLSVHSAGLLINLLLQPFAKRPEPALPE